LVPGLSRGYQGRDRLFTEISNLPTFEQPLRMGYSTGAPRVATLDVVATRRDRTLYIHAINRHLRDAVPARIETGRLGVGAGAARMHALTGPVTPGAQDGYAEIADRQIEFTGDAVPVEFPARSVTVVEIPLR
jgi:hypothetical protein